MDPISQQAFVAAGAGGSDPLYVDDVFSIDLYRNDSTTEEFNNGLDMAGEGGLIVTTFRDLGTNRAFVDSERGVTKVVYGDSSNQESTAAWIQSFDDDGFTHGSYIGTGNNSGVVSWSFRKCPGFFDVVTYTGNGTSGRTVSHNLGSVPGMIIVKNLHDTGYSWAVWHKGLGNNGYLFLNSNNQENTNSVYFPSQPTASNFVVGTSGLVNINGDSYVAYVFADNDASFGANSDEAVIKCGSYTGSGSDGNFVNVGFEPQWLMIKNISSANTNWLITDVMRGMPASGGTTKVLYLNTDASETTQVNIAPNPTGFTLSGSGSYSNQSSNTFIYMAIRRPHKPPTAGTDVLAIDNQGTGTMPPQYHSNFVVDWAFNVAFGETSAYRDRDNFTRLLGRTKLSLNNQDQEASFNSARWDYMDGWYNNNSSVSTSYSWMFKRAPGFFDVVTYTGNGADNHQVSHNLGVRPEFAFFKERDSGNGWVNFNNMASSTYSYGFNFFGEHGTQSYGSGFRLFAQPSATQLFLTDYSVMNESNKVYVAYLFASLDGISKVGTYSGSSGNNVNVDCGFTAGARFVMIKGTSGLGGANADTYVWDSTRGIVSGNDPYFLLNTNGTEVTGTDYIDPLNAGFTVTSSAPAALNNSGGTYLFLAIA